MLYKIIRNNASTKVDELAYTYTNMGNQVNKIVDTGTSVGFPNGTANYTYTAAGRIKTDSQKGITDITYNHLGFPTSIKKGSSASNDLKYTYDATGRKAKRQLGTGTARYYVDGVEYEGANLKFIVTPYGRIRKDVSNWIYDYFLKDHLGNVRVVLEAGSATSSSSSSNQTVYIATMEEDRAAEENLYFENVDATRDDRPFNYPDENPLNTKVSKVPGKSEGLKLSLKVMAGDTIEISAKAFYNIDNSYPGASVNIAPIVGGILAGMSNPVNTVTGEATQLANDLGTVAGKSTMLSNLPDYDQNDKTVQPKSGLNFVLYNGNFEIVEENTGYLPVEDNINAIQILATDKMVMKESGYLEIFVNNDAQTPVYYDNMMVMMLSGPVMEVNAYYPYGMIIPDLSEAATYGANAYKYNNKELQTDHDLQWLDYGARMYDPRGRAGWLLPDPLAEKYYSISPYAYCANNPILYVDPDGRKIVLARKNFARTLLDVGRIYATREGRGIIRTLAASSETYKIGGGRSSSFNKLTNKITYLQKDAVIDGVKTQSHEFLAHELYHAYQKDQNIRYEDTYKFDRTDLKEADAMKFENYIREVYGSSEKRINRSGKQLLNKQEAAMPTFGERIDLNSVKTSTNVFEFNNENSQYEDNTAVQDNTRMNRQQINIQHILEYMDKNSLERLIINFR